MKDSHLYHQLKRVNIDKFQHDLISWFQTKQRILPWREDQDPYKVWVSEIMLQQTKVDTVIPYFQEFMEKFPTIEALAEADEQEVLKAWEGLGYYSRARNLQSAVKEVATSYDGKVPEDAEKLGALKGVGPYTKGAILSIAYGIPEPAVDGNVMRVLSRVLRMEDDIAKVKTRRKVEDAIRLLISQEDPSAFNQGLMELGALICTPKSPACSRCPIQAHCQAFKDGVETELPIKSKTKKQKKQQYFTYVLVDSNGAYLVEQRPSQGLLANMWQFPMVDKQLVDEEHLPIWIEQRHQLSLTSAETLPMIRHVFSHVIWELDVRLYYVQDIRDHTSLFLTLDELSRYPFPVPYQKLIAYLTEQS